MKTNGTIVSLMGNTKSQSSVNEFPLTRNERKEIYHRFAVDYCLHKIIWDIEYIGREISILDIPDDHLIMTSVLEFYHHLSDDTRAYFIDVINVAITAKKSGFLEDTHLCAERLVSLLDPRRIKFHLMFGEGERLHQVVRGVQFIINRGIPLGEPHYPKDVDVALWTMKYYRQLSSKDQDFLRGTLQTVIDAMNEKINQWVYQSIDRPIQDHF